MKVKQTWRHRHVRIWITEKESKKEQEEEWPGGWGSGRGKDGRGGGYGGGREKRFEGYHRWSAVKHDTEKKTALLQRGGVSNG